MKIKPNTLCGMLFSGLLSKPDKLEVIIDHEGGNLVEMSVRCHGSDRSRLLGKAGRHFRAIKEILGHAGRHQGQQWVLTEMREPKEGTQELFPPFAFRPDWPREPVTNTIRTVVEQLVTKPVLVESTQQGNRCRFTIKCAKNEPGENVALINQQIPVLVPSITMTQGSISTVEVIWEGAA